MAGRAFILGILAIFVSSCNFFSDDRPAPAKTLPVLSVVDSGGLTKADADRLALALNLGTEWPWELVAGNITYLDRDKFLLLPTTDDGPGPQDADGNTTIRKFDFTAINALTVLTPAQAESRLRDILQQAGLDVVEGTPHADHSRFEVRNPDGSNFFGPKEIDTVVSYTFSSGGIPVEGPGARIVMAFNGAGDVTMVHYAWRKVIPGPEVELLPEDQVMAMLAHKLGTVLDVDGLPAGFTIQDKQLVYYAPPLTVAAKQLYPYYRIQASGTFDDGGERDTFAVRDIYVPAFSLPLDVSLVNVQMTPGDPELGIPLQLSADTIVSNGRPPFDYRWISSSRYLSHATYHEGSITFEPNPGARSGNETAENLTVVVTDADGQRARAEVSVDYPPGAVGAIPLAGPGNFAAAWTSTCARLWMADDNGRGFVETMLARGETMSFLFDEKEVWEKDFKDAVIQPTGLDHQFVDNVDIFFYTGHASAAGFYLCDSSHDDRVVRYNEVRWGDSDLEWIISAACGPLQIAHWDNWQAAFDGLHLLLGYGSVSVDNEVEGETFANFSHPQSMFGGTLPLPAFPVLVSWVMATYASQPQGRVWAVMGVTGNNGGTSYHDHLWGQGTVSPDLRPGSSTYPIDGYWLLNGLT